MQQLDLSTLAYDKVYCAGIRKGHESDDRVTLYFCREGELAAKLVLNRETFVEVVMRGQTHFKGLSMSEQ